MEHKQVIVLRKDLNMRKGKMVAQGAHASMRAILNGARREGDVLIIPLDARNEPWLCGRFKKICVSVNSESEIRFNSCCASPCTCLGPQSQTGGEHLYAHRPVTA
jgi:peptidyl-tRNA hydrolase